MKFGLFESREVLIEIGDRKIINDIHRSAADAFISASVRKPSDDTWGKQITRDRRAVAEEQITQAREDVIGLSRDNEIDPIEIAMCDQSH